MIQILSHNRIVYSLLWCKVCITLFMLLFELVFKCKITSNIYLVICVCVCINAPVIFNTLSPPPPSYTCLFICGITIKLSIPLCSCRKEKNSGAIKNCKIKMKMSNLKHLNNNKSNRNSIEHWEKLNSIKLCEIFL